MSLFSRISEPKKQAPQGFYTYYNEVQYRVALFSSTSFWFAQRIVRLS
jgi:hypothetical protein